MKVGAFTNVFCSLKPHRNDQDDCERTIEKTCDIFTVESKTVKRDSRTTRGRTSYDGSSTHVAMAAQILCMKILLGVFMSMFLVLVALVFILFARTHHMNEAVASMQTTVGAMKHEDNRRICLTCSVANQFIVGGLKVADYFEVEQTLERCCVKDLDAFMRLLNTVIYKNVNREIINARGICADCNKKNVSCGQDVSGPSNCTRPAAHVVRGGPQMLESTGEGESLRYWSDNRDGAFRKGIGYEDGRLVIQITGHYYVYSQVYFVETFTHDVSLLPPEDVHDNTPKRLWHSVYKYNDDWPTFKETVLKNVKSKCWARRKDFGMQSSYVGAVMKLNAGDQLGIIVSNVSLVPRDPSATYFGAYMV